MEHTEMKTEEQQKMDKLLHRIKTADRFRLFFLFTALFLVLFLFYADKFLNEAVWFMQSKQTIYDILFYDVICMLISTFVKIGMASSYNRLVKMQRKG